MTPHAFAYYMHVKCICNIIGSNVLYPSLRPTPYPTTYHLHPPATPFMHIVVKFNAENKGAVEILVDDQPQTFQFDRMFGPDSKYLFLCSFRADIA